MTPIFIGMHRSIRALCSSRRRPGHRGLQRVHTILKEEAVDNIAPTAHSCTQLYTTAHNGEQLYTTVHSCTQLHTTVHNCAQLYTTVHNCTQRSVVNGRFFHLSASLRSCTPASLTQSAPPIHAGADAGLYGLLAMLHRGSVLCGKRRL